MIKHPYYMMSILNITPDSFSDGGQFYASDELQSDALISKAREHLSYGSHILDIGGESTRPGAREIPEAEERARVIPAIRHLHRAFPGTLLSVDTRKSGVAQAALQAGAGMINDISGLQYDGAAMAGVAADSGAYLVIMHSQGVPETMQQHPAYTDIIAELIDFFEKQVQLAISCGISREKIILDPGFGFGKTLQHNLTLLKHLSHFIAMGLPIMAGLSRKSFLTLGENIPPAEREELTAASLALAMAGGATYFRVHAPHRHAAVLRLAHQALMG